MTNNLFKDLGKIAHDNISEAAAEKASTLKAIQDTLSNEIINLTKSTKLHADTQKVRLRFSNISTSPNMLKDNSNKSPLTLDVEFIADDKKLTEKKITLLKESPFKPSSPFLDGSTNLPSELRSENFSIKLEEIFGENILPDGSIIIYDQETDPGFWE